MLNRILLETTEFRLSRVLMARFDPQIIVCLPQHYKFKKEKYITNDNTFCMLDIVYQNDEP